MKALMKFLMGAVILSMFTLYSCDDDDNTVLGGSATAETLENRIGDKIWFLTEEVKTEVDDENNYAIKEVYSYGGENLNSGPDNASQVIMFETFSNKFYKAVSHRDEMGNYKFEFDTRTSDSWEIKDNAVIVQTYDSEGYKLKKLIVEDRPSDELVLFWSSRENDYKHLTDSLSSETSPIIQGNFAKLNELGAMHSTQTFVSVKLDETGNIERNTSPF